jgi:hypothetical protein
MLLWMIALTSIRPGVVEGPIAGVWHNSTSVGSGYCELYALYPDGSFRWRENQMDGVSRIRDRWGHWSCSGDSLVLLVDSISVWEGGRLVPAECSIGTDSMLVDFTGVILRPARPESLVVRLSSLELDLMDENEDLPADLWGMDFDGSRFWRISSGDSDMDWFFRY